MKKNELRIGNYVKDMDYDYVTIAGIHPESTNELTVCINDCDVGDRLFKDVEGIPLTEEWLIKFGFKQGNSMNFYWNKLIRDNINISIDPDDGEVWVCDIFDNESIILTEIKYVHQLQNLYFALTGKELTIK